MNSFKKTLVVQNDKLEKQCFSVQTTPDCKSVANYYTILVTVQFTEPVPYVFYTVKYCYYNITMSDDLSECVNGSKGQTNGQTKDKKGLRMCTIGAYFHSYRRRRH